MKSLVQSGLVLGQFPQSPQKFMRQTNSNCKAVNFKSKPFSPFIHKILMLIPSRSMYVTTTQYFLGIRESLCRENYCRLVSWSAYSEMSVTLYDLVRNTE